MGCACVKKTPNIEVKGKQNESLTKDKINESNINQSIIEIKERSEVNDKSGNDRNDNSIIIEELKNGFKITNNKNHGITSVKEGTIEFENSNNYIQINSPSVRIYTKVNDNGIQIENPTFGDKNNFIYNSSNNKSSRKDIKPSKFLNLNKTNSCESNSNEFQQEAYIDFFTKKKIEIKLCRSIASDNPNKTSEINSSMSICHTPSFSHLSKNSSLNPANVEINQQVNTSFYIKPLIDTEGEEKMKNNTLSQEKHRLSFDNTKHRNSLNGRFLKYDGNVGSMKSKFNQK